MKRRRTSPGPLARLEARLWGGTVIPPTSVVKLTNPNGWLGDAQFRIGYYSKQDGLNIVRLVDEHGEYSETVDQGMIRQKFTVLHRSDETDFYGQDRPVLGPLKSGA